MLPAPGYIEDICLLKGQGHGCFKIKFTPGLTPRFPKLLWDVCARGIKLFGAGLNLCK